MIKIFFSTNYWVMCTEGKFYFETKVISGLVENLPNTNIITSGYKTDHLDPDNLFPLDGDCITLSGSKFANFLKLLIEVKSSDLVIFKMFQLTNLLVFCLCIFYRKKFVMMIVGDAPKSLLMRSDLIPTKILRLIFSKILSRVIKLMVSRSFYSIFVSTDLKGRFGGREHDVVASESWLDEKWFRKDRKKIKYDFLYVGRLVVEKGLTEFLQAIASDQLLRRSRIAIVGDGKDRTKLEILARSSGLKIDFKGKVKPNSDALRHLYDQSSIFVLPSYSEGTPLCLLEAASKGCILVSTPVGGVPELLGSTYPLYVKPQSVSSLREALVRALGMSELEKKRLLQELENIAWQHSFSAEQKKMWDPIKEILNEK